MCFNMKTFKKIITWVVIMIIAYIAIDFSNFYIIASTYKDIEAQIHNKENISITVNESKATYVNGYVKITITNNTQTQINNKYILLDGYSKNNNCLVNRYVKIDNFKSNETREIQIPFKAQEVKKVNIYESEKIQDKYEPTSEIIDGPTLLITAIIFLYFFG